MKCHPQAGPSSLAMALLFTAQLSMAYVAFQVMKGAFCRELLSCQVGYSLR